MFVIEVSAPPDSGNQSVVHKYIKSTHHTPLTYTMWQLHLKKIVIRIEKILFPWDNNLVVLHPREDNHVAKNFQIKFHKCHNRSLFPSSFFLSISHPPSTPTILLFTRSGTVRKHLTIVVYHSTTSSPLVKISIPFRVTEGRCKQPSAISQVHTDANR